jgi:ADP-ribosylglycohydrolase
MFDYIFDNIAHLPRLELLKNALKFAPESYQEKLEKALSMENTRDFIKQYAGIACHIPQSVPLIFRILNQCSSYQDMVETNVKLGGASGERAMLLGAIFAQISEVPQEWTQLTNK